MVIPDIFRTLFGTDAHSFDTLLSWENGTSHPFLGHHCITEVESLLGFTDSLMKFQTLEFELVLGKNELCWLIGVKFSILPYGENMDCRARRECYGLDVFLYQNSH